MWVRNTMESFVVMLEIYENVSCVYVEISMKNEVREKGTMR